MNDGLASLSILRDPLTGERLSLHHHKMNGDTQATATGVLTSSSNEYPIVGGVVIFKQDLITDDVLKSAKEGNFSRALFHVLRAETGSMRQSSLLYLRECTRRLFQLKGFPSRVFKGGFRTYLKYRFYVPNFPAGVGVISCLNRCASSDGYMLDVGPGLGHFYSYFLHAYPAEKIVLMDHTVRNLVALGRFVQAGTLLICSDADESLPFDKGVFSDVISINAFQFLKRKDEFLRRASEILEPSHGTLWLTNNWNPNVTDQFSGKALTPTVLAGLARGANVRLYPDKHFALPVLKGGLLNLGVHYVPRDDHPDWRSVTLVCSNDSLDRHNIFVPLNSTPKLSRLRLNSVYTRVPFSRLAIKRNIRLKYWDSHRDYFGYKLPNTIRIPFNDEKRYRQTIRSLSEKMIMVETIFDQPYSSVFSKYFLVIKDSLIMIIQQSSPLRAVLNYLPSGGKTLIKRFLRIA